MREKIVTHPRGGRSSKVTGRFDLLPAKAIAVLAGVLEEGAAKYAPNNWRLVPRDEHLNHVIAHLVDSLRAKSRSERDEHTAHAFCRLAFVLETE